MRRELDEIDPRSIREGFRSVFHEVQRGKPLERFRFLSGHLLALDGSEIFNKDGRTTYYRQILAGAIVHPEMKQVIPLCPEPITKPDVATKNDCQSNATKGFLASEEGTSSS